MKTAFRTRYGSPDVLTIHEGPRPVPSENEVLIRVRAATVNRTDCAVLSGEPFVFRFFTGLLHPKFSATGTDFAGEIEDTGKGATRFKIGDRVWGFRDSGLGSHAQYMTLNQNAEISTIPDGVSCEQAAASAEGAHYALNFINKIKLNAGDKVLVNGATGAIGSAAVQLLKNAGASVTAVCGTRQVDLVASLSADRVIDYEKQDFTQDDETYAFVFDAVGKSTFGRCKRLLAPRGIYLSSELGPMAQNPFLALFTPLLGGKKVVFPVPSDIKGSLAFMRALLEQRKFTAVIDRRYPLEDLAQAFRYAASGQKIGNVILTFD